MRVKSLQWEGGEDAGWGDACLMHPLNQADVAHPPCRDQRPRDTRQSVLKDSRVRLKCSPCSSPPSPGLPNGGRVPPAHVGHKSGFRVTFRLVWNRPMVIGCCCVSVALCSFWLPAQGGLIGVSLGLGGLHRKDLVAYSPNTRF